MRKLIGLPFPRGLVVPLNLGYIDCSGHTYLLCYNTMIAKGAGALLHFKYRQQHIILPN